MFNDQRRTNERYSRMNKDVRAAVDLCHRDGTLKKMVAKDPKDISTSHQLFPC